MPMEAVVALLFLVGGAVLTVGLGIGYYWMRNVERDTRLVQENGKTPKLEVFGSGRVNRRQWSQKRGCRISIYEDFVVISVSSQRLFLPFYLIREIDTEAGPEKMTLRGLTENETAISIDFRGPDAERVAALLREHRKPPKVAGRS